MFVWMPGDLKRTGLCNRIINGLEKSDIINNGVVPETVFNVVVSDRCADGNHRGVIIHALRLGYGKRTVGTQYLAGIPHAFRDLVASFMSERMVVG